MVRLVVRCEDNGAAANVTGAIAHVSFKTFVIDNPELEALLQPSGYVSAQLVGAEVFKP